MMGANVPIENMQFSIEKLPDTKKKKQVIVKYFFW